MPERLEGRKTARLTSPPQFQVRLSFNSTEFLSFDLISVDLAEYSTVVPNAVTVRFVGYRSDGRTVITNFTTDGIIDGTGPLADFQTFTFGPEFSDLAHVEIPTQVWSLDNLVVRVRESDRIVKYQPVAWGGKNCDTNSVLPPGLSNLVAVSAGGHSGALLNLGLRPDGTVTSWGVGYPGYKSVTNVPPGLSNVVAASAGSSHALVLLADGTVRSWGASGSPSALTNPPPGLTNVVSIAAGGSFSLALRSEGTVVQWPTNEVPEGLSKVVAIAAGDNHCLALSSDGTVIGWGADWRADLDWSRDGLENGPNIATNVVGITAGKYLSFALRGDGEVVTKGINPLLAPVPIPPEATNVVAIAAGGSASLALRDDGTVVAWGYNNTGQICVPPGLSNVVAISVGYASCLALVGEAPPALQVPASAPKLKAGGFSLVLPTQSGRVYRLEYVESLTEANWTLLPLVAGTGQKLTLTDPSAKSSQRFCRVRQW